MQWKACGREIYQSSPLVMGIVNVTPDSFSDGGRYLDADAAVDRALKHVENGAGLLDVGGESTRPGAPPVDEAEELRRIIPVISRLSGETDVPVSIDTQKPAVAHAAIAAGAVVINDIASNREDDAMWRVVADTGAGYIAMHMQGTPQTMQESPAYGDVVAEVEAFFLDRMDRFAAAGVSAEQVAIDPGIGFGKTVAHNLELLKNLQQFITFRRPVVVGASRKSFLGGDVSERLPGSLACAVHAIAQGAQIVRVHDVRETVAAVKTMEAILTTP